MPLLDHFHEPIWPSRHWQSFHNAWATFIAGDINRRLPEGYFAEGNVEFNIEIDVATIREAGAPEPEGASWTPPSPTITIPFTTTTDVVEILISESMGGTTLVGAIELVSPANKDRDATRSAFVSKCLGYLHEGIGLVIVDVVTSRKANLHNQLMCHLNDALAWDAELYAVSYHPVQEKAKALGGSRNGDTQKSLEIWPHQLQIGERLPKLPLWLKGGLCLPFDLESTYTRTCEEYRISRNGK